MIVVSDVSMSESFLKDLQGVKPDIAQAAKDAIKLLRSNPRAGSLRLHPLRDHKPTVWKIDVLSNKSWQITFDLQGTTARLLRLAPHRVMDRLY